MDPPKISLANSNFAPRAQRLHLDPAIAELPVAAGLLLVPPLDVGLPANGLAIRNLGRLQRDIHAITLLHAADHDFHVLLARAGEQKLARLRIAIEAQRLVLFQNAVHRLPHAIFVVARLGFNGESDGRLRQFHRRIDRHSIPSPARCRRSGCPSTWPPRRCRRRGLRAPAAGFSPADCRCGPAVRCCRGRGSVRLASFFTVPVITLK